MIKLYFSLLKRVCKITIKYLFNKQRFTDIFDGGLNGESTSEKGSSYLS
jgi:hypothetical protein